MRPRRLIAGCFVLALAGCVSTYVAQDGDSASIAFSRGAMHLGARSLQEFEGYADVNCTPSGGTGRLAALLTYMGTQKEARVSAGRRLYLLAKTSEFSTGPGIEPGSSFALVRDSCLNLASFTPQRGREYQATQEQSGAGCRIEVTDLSTRAAPPDLRLEPVQACAARVR